MVRADARKSPGAEVHEGDAPLVERRVVRLHRPIVALRRTGAVVTEAELQRGVVRDGLEEWAERRRVARPTGPQDAAGPGHHVEVHIEPDLGEGNGRIPHEVPCAAQPLLLVVEQSDHHRVARRRPDEQLGDLHDHGDARGVVVRAVVDDPVTDALVVVVCRKHDVGTRFRSGHESDHIDAPATLPQVERLLEGALQWLDTGSA